MMYQGTCSVAPGQEMRAIVLLPYVLLLSCKYFQHQSNQSYDLQYDLPKRYDGPTVSLLRLSQRSEIVQQTSSYYHTTLQPYRSPVASSSTRQHHECEAAYPRCIGPYDPSPRIVRAGGADAYTPTTCTPHQPSATATRKSYNKPISARCSSVSCCSGCSVQFSSSYAY